jgi:hypothetical protein
MVATTALRSLYARTSRGNQVSWTEETSGTSQDLLAVSCSGFAIHAVGNQGTILARGNDGWAPEDSGTTLDLFGVSRCALYTQCVIAVGAQGIILTRTQ